MSTTSTPKTTDIGVLAAAVEVVKGSAETFTAAHGGIECYDPAISFDLPSAERNPLRPYHDAELSVAAGPRQYGLSFGCALKGASAAGAPPEFAELLRACALSETIVGGTSVTYAPVAAVEDQETATVGLYQDGVLYQMAGAMGSAALRFEQGQIGMVDFTMSGTYAQPTATTVLANTELHGITPPSIDAVTLTYRSSSLCATSVTVDLTNEIVPRRCMTTAGGVDYFLKRGMDVTITVDPEVDPVGTRDFVQQIVDGTAGAFVIAVGSVAGNICTVTCPMVQVLEAGPQDRDGIAVYSITMKARAASPSGNDSISIAWT